MKDMRLQHALRLGDGAAARRAALAEDLEDAFTQWQLAVIEGRRDEARALLDAAEADTHGDDWERRTLRVEALMSRAQWREAVVEATRLRDETTSAMTRVRAQSRLAWSHWQSGALTEACRASARLK